MEFFKELGQRTLNFIDNHPRVLAGVVAVYSLIFHPALTLVTCGIVAIVAYVRKEQKK